MIWNVKNFNMNRQVIENYNILKYMDPWIKKQKKKCETKEEFAEVLHRELQYHFWSRAEYELVIVKEDNGSIWLVPWVGCRNEDIVKINVTNDNSFDWAGFAEEHIGKQIYKNKAKIDVFDQCTYANQFDKLVDYVWYTRQKYQRKHPKFEK